MSGRFLPYGRPCLDEDDIAAVTEVLRGDWLTTGPRVAQFEGALAERLGAAEAVICSSGTAALHLAYLAAGIGPGDRVVVPALTFTATAAAALLVGAEVVLADVDPQSGLLRPEDLAAALERGGAPTHPPKAVTTVHLNGQAANLPALRDLARPQHMTLIEDACHAIGGGYLDGAAECRIGACDHTEFACISFHPVKTIAMGEGGAVTTNDRDAAARLRRLRHHGLEREAARLEDRTLAGQPWYHEIQSLGLNYRASDIHCALGLSQLAKLDDFVARRQALVARYDELLAPLAPHVRPVARVSWARPAWHLYAVLIDFDALGQPRGSVMKRLRAAGIGTQVHYIPLHLQPLYRRRYGALELPGAEAYYARQLSLPLFVGMTNDEVTRVVTALKSALML